jgi:hypothetical protein
MFINYIGLSHYFIQLNLNIRQVKTKTTRVVELFGRGLLMFEIMGLNPIRLIFFGPMDEFPYVRRFIYK